MKDVGDIVNAIETMHECKCRWVGAVPVVEVFRGETAWEGTVEIFTLINHPKAKKCYAWYYIDDDGKKQYTAVLEIPPVDSPETAVKVAIAAKA